MFRRNLAIMSGPRYQRGRDLFEGSIESLIVEENPVVVEIPIESILNLSNRLYNFPQV